MREMRLAVVGAGLIGKRHARLIHESPRARLVAIADADPGAEGFASALGARFWPSVDELLAVGGVDGVVIATPNHLHVEQALRCVEAGIPVLVEKPISDSLEDARRLGVAAEAARVPVLVGHHRRHSAILRAVREVIADGAVGDLVTISGTALYTKPTGYFDVAPWRSGAAGGPILINLIHEVDVLRMLCGEIETIETIGSNARRGFPVEDTVALAMRFASGALGTFLLSDSAASVRSWENLSGEDPAFPRYDHTDCYTIAGTRGSIEIPTMRLRTFAGQASWWNRMEEHTIEVPPHDPLAAQLDHFCDVAVGSAAPEVTPRDATRTLEIVLDVAAQARQRLAA